VKVMPDGSYQAEVGEIRYPVPCEPEVSDELLDRLREMVEVERSMTPVFRKSYLLHDPDNARIVLAVLADDVLTVWTDRDYANATMKSHAIPGVPDLQPGHTGVRMRT
jgi:hypothetical protein